MPLQRSNRKRIAWRTSRFITPNDEVKFVIGDRGDFDYARAVIATRLSGRRDLKPPLFSPVFGRLDPASLARWILEDHLDVRLQIQLHKVIWGAGEARRIGQGGSSCPAGKRSSSPAAASIPRRHWPSQRRRGTTSTA